MGNKWRTDLEIWEPEAYQFKPDSQEYTYYVGNGAVSSNYYMAEYAGYTTANVRNVGNDDHANGKVSQAVTTNQERVV